jgi:PAS domain S-box-containing protein
MSTSEGVVAGLKAEEAYGAGWIRALHPKDRERIATEWYAAIREHRLFKSVYRFLRPDGRIIWVYGQAAGEESEIRDGVHSQNMSL